MTTIIFLLQLGCRLDQDGRYPWMERLLRELLVPQVWTYQRPALAGMVQWHHIHDAKGLLRSLDSSYAGSNQLRGVQHMR